MAARCVNVAGKRCGRQGATVACAGVQVSVGSSDTTSGRSMRPALGETKARRAVS